MFTYTADEENDVKKKYSPSAAEPANPLIAELSRQLALQEFEAMSVH